MDIIMQKTYLILIFVTVITISILPSSSYANEVVDSNSGPTIGRSFTIDYENNQFLMDGKPFRFIAGSFHYFRAHPDSWQRKLQTMRSAGLNAVTTYVEWSLHKPKHNVYNWEGIADLVKFIKLAQEEDLYVILRPGPYICAERDLGGFPYWLLNKYPSIQLRTSDINYLFEVRIWYSQLMPKIEPYLYGNGGPIIMVQVENEYGSFYACDRKYRQWLRDETESYVKGKAVLFTNDGPSLLRCGYIDGVLPTLDFGPGDDHKRNWNMLRKYLPKGPLVNSEYYPGWLTHWQEPMQRRNTTEIVRTFEQMLEYGANVNFYMFYGGTNFGFTAGANDDSPGKYRADVTSYDYDAPMTEAGDPTEKFLAIREVIKKYLPLPNIPVPASTSKKYFGEIQLKSCCSILSHEGRRHLSSGVVNLYKPPSFEALDQYSGLVLYETHLPRLSRDPSELTISDLRDRAYVYIDRIYVGVMSRENRINSLSIDANSGNILQILVENQGRINYNIPNDFKGILSDVILDKTILTNWNITKFPFDDYKQIEALIDSKEEFTSDTNIQQQQQHKTLLKTGPMVFYGELEITNDADIQDTYLDPSGWHKGIAFINGFNLGRYWPVVGPQITLYVPKEVLVLGINKIVIIEYQRTSYDRKITLTDVPNLDG